MRIAFIDHSYHKTTKSTGFLTKILAEIGEVHFFYDDSWRQENDPWRQEKQDDWRHNFIESNYDLIIIFQVHEAFSALSGKHDNVVFVPMYDAMIAESEFYWKKAFGKAKCLSFSRKLH